MGAKGERFSASLKLGSRLGRMEDEILLNNHDIATLNCTLVVGQIFSLVVQPYNTADSRYLPSSSHADWISPLFAF